MNVQLLTRVGEPVEIPPIHAFTPSEAFLREKRIVRLSTEFLARAEQAGEETRVGAVRLQKWSISFPLSDDEIFAAVGESRMHYFAHLYRFLAQTERGMYAFPFADFWAFVYWNGGWVLTEVGVQKGPPWPPEVVMVAPVA